MCFVLIHIGDILTLELDSSDDDAEKFKCRLVDRKGDQLYIDYPINLKTNKAAFLLDGTRIEATFVGHDGSSIFLFESQIIGRIRKNIPMLILSYPGDEHLIKIQRRQYVRIETAVDIAIQPIEFEFAPFTAITEDLSAGGSSVLVPQDINLKTGTSVHSWIALSMQNGDYHYMKLASRIVRNIPYNETRNKVFIQFIDVTSQERQILLRFCFEKQLENKKKGLPS